MKKNLFFLLAAIMSASLIVFGANISSAETNVSAGTIIKGKGNPTLYYVGEDGKRYVFPNANTYFSWFNDFTQVSEIELEDLYDVPLGGNVRYKPGALLVKIQTDPKVYAVGENGKLRWIKSEALAKALYGNNWNKLVDDVPDSFFTNYEVDEAIETEEDYDPVEEEEQAPTISHNKGFKALAKAKVRNRNEKMCGRLEGALDRIQKRFERWGVEITDESNEVLEKCYGIADDLTDKKATLCHNGQTIKVSRRAAINAHLKHGDTLGECVDSTLNSGDDASDDAQTSLTTDDLIDDTSDDSGASSTDDTVDSETGDDNASSTDDVASDNASSTDDSAE